jgi:hypothetical protein
MNAFWKHLAAKIAPYLVVALVAGGWFASYTREQREIGRRDLLLAQARADVASASRRADSLAKVYRVDTVRLTRLLQRWDTLYARVTDTVTLARTDTVRVPVQVLVTADSTIRACHAVVATCEQRVAAEHAWGLGWQRQAEQLHVARPSGARLWLERGLFLAAGFGASRIYR